MRLKHKIASLFLSFLLQLIVLEKAHTEPQREDRAREWTLSISLPKTDRLTLVSWFPLTQAGRIVGGLATYDDAATARSVDYLEVFDTLGHLLVISWFDEFGIRRTAVNDSLFANSDYPGEVFTLLLDGDIV